MRPNLLLRDGFRWMTTTLIMTRLTLILYLIKGIKMERVLNTTLGSEISTQMQRKDKEYL